MTPAAAETAVGGGSVPHPLVPGRRIRAVLFDLDGTLYRQSPVRALMALEMTTLALVSPASAAKIVRVLRQYRHAQEALRGHAATDSLASAQVAFAAARTGVSHEHVEAIVAEWMIQRPLKYLRRFAAPGTAALLDRLRGARVRVGLFSDYPAEEKLRALGLEGRFSPVLCASDPAINRFKPDPRGFLAAAEAWGLPPADVLMVGDRYEVDFIGARAAGMPCVLVGRPRAVPAGDAVAVFSSFERLARVIDGNHS